MFELFETKYESIYRTIPSIEFESNKLKVFWKETIATTEKDLLEALCVETYERMFSTEKNFWDQNFSEENNDDKNLNP